MQEEGRPKGEDFPFYLPKAGVRSYFCGHGNVRGRRKNGCDEARVG